jgi:thiazole synthase
MRIKLNGESHEIAGPLTVTALLAQLGIDARRVAVEHNLVVLKRAAFEQTVVNEGDEVEIVNFVGGGAAMHARRGSSEWRAGRVDLLVNPARAPRRGWLLAALSWLLLLRKPCKIC